MKNVWMFRSRRKLCVGGTSKNVINEGTRNLGEKLMLELLGFFFSDVSLNTAYHSCVAAPTHLHVNRSFAMKNVWMFRSRRKLCVGGTSKNVINEGTRNLGEKLMLELLGFFFLVMFHFVLS